ncbi:MAG: hypothetical protein LUD73_04540 [Lachnospiraceae bacterium]|nr:hypothetical protein [Lachnospiraceae bacterium]
MNLQDRIDYSALIILWLAVLFMNTIAKRYLKDIAASYFPYSMGIAAMVTVFALLYKFR